MERKQFYLFFFQKLRYIFCDASSALCKVNNRFTLRKQRHRVQIVEESTLESLGKDWSDMHKRRIRT